MALFLFLCNIPLLIVTRCVVWNRTSPVGYEPTVQPLHLPALNVHYKQKSDKRDWFQHMKITLIRSVYNDLLWSVSESN